MCCSWYLVLGSQGNCFPKQVNKIIFNRKVLNVVKNRISWFPTKAAIKTHILFKLIEI